MCFVLFGGTGVPCTRKGGRRIEWSAANVKIRVRGLHGKLGRGPWRGWKERSGVCGGGRAYFATNLLFRLQLAFRPATPFSLKIIIKKCKEIQLAGGFAFGVQLPSSVSALAGRDGGG